MKTDVPSYNSPERKAAPRLDPKLAGGLLDCHRSGNGGYRNRSS
jgi:hypothetical protein